jgi:hypothetical protein
MVLPDCHFQVNPVQLTLLMVVAGQACRTCMTPAAAAWTSKLGLPTSEFNHTLTSAI